MPYISDKHVYFQQRIYLPIPSICCSASIYSLKCRNFIFRIALMLHLIMLHLVYFLLLL